MISPTRLRAAVVLAETRHFGRAAQRLYLSQPAFSQQIAGLERGLGVKLFERRAREVSLTPAGAAFTERAERLLEDLEVAVAEVRQIARGSAGELTVGFFGSGPSELMSWFLDAYSAAWPDVTVRLAELSMADQVDRLTEKRVDVAFLYPPVHDPRILMRPLFAEPRVAALPAQHPLADADQLSVADLLDEQFATAAPPTPAEWRAFWACDAERGEPGRTAADVRTIGECMAAIAYLGAVDTWSLSGSRWFRHPGVRCVPVSGPYTSLAVAQRRDDVRCGVRAFCELAVRIARDHVEVVPGAVRLEDAPRGTPVPVVA